MTKPVMPKGLFQSVILASVLALSTQASAHHSTAAFDMSKTVNLEGTIKSYQWSNPHSYLQVVVSDGKGGHSEWAIESGAPELGLRMGWTKNSVKAGDKVKLQIIPLKTGARGQGILKSCTLPSGKTLYGPGYRPTPSGGPPPGKSVLPDVQRATPKQDQ
ncbi:hypothetical protein WSK_1435 [Novosphingobium sp. Rr 2-17]|uniref:DUF6152 family protein n=1 Tax=Novosphingobium sp. Rr 2-17 TaxID=555793 RepID=UPI0002698B9D|nr:DUF6152 family protein [Novosphingobium sp. Rr 2-17]EIZ80068.1 hypothetical protein WSK_1435 [Novosphingobium sp. Rr 2-17]